MIIKLRSQGACASVVIGALLGACIYYVARKSGIGKKSFSLPRYFKKEKPKFSFNEPKLKNLKKVVATGPIGSGKSTLLSQIARAFDTKSSPVKSATLNRYSVKKGKFTFELWDRIRAQDEDGMEIETFSSAFFCFYFFNKCDVVLHFFDSTQQFEFDEQIEVLLDALNDPKVRDPLTLVVVTKTDMEPVDLENLKQAIQQRVLPYKIEIIESKAELFPKGVSSSSNMGVYCVPSAIRVMNKIYDMVLQNQRSICAIH